MRCIGRRIAAAAIGLFISSLAISSLSAVEWVDLELREGTNFAVALLPNGQGLVMDLQGTLWRLGPDGGLAQPLTDGLGDDRLPDVASDGSRIVFQSFRSGNWDIWSVDPDGANLTQLTDSEFDDREPVLSPDGKRLAFSSDRSGNYDVWVMDLVSGELTQLSQHEANDYMPTWSPDSASLVFVSDRTGRGGKTEALVHVDLANALEAVIREFEGAITSPSFSPDGRSVALRRLEFVPLTLMGTRFDRGHKSELVLVPIDGSESTRSLNTAPDVFPFRAQWNGNAEIVFSASGSIWRLPFTDDFAAEQATKIPFEVKVSLNRPEYGRASHGLPAPGDKRKVKGLVRPVVSPDGETIAYAALGDIWLVPSEGGEAVPLTRDEYLDTSPSWSPDGTRLVYASDRGGTMDLWIKEVNSAPGSGERQLTFLLGAEWGASWSPDGKTIAFLDERSRLMTVSPEAGDLEEPKELAKPQRSFGLPSWSPDGEHLAIADLVPFSSRFREGHNRIRIVSSVTGQSSLLSEPNRSFGTRDGDGPVWSPDGQHLAFALDGGLWVLPVSPDGTPRERMRQVIDESFDFVTWASSSELVYSAVGTLKSVRLSSGTPREIDVLHEYTVASSGGTLLLQDFRLIDGTGSAPQDHMDVLIEGDRILSVRPTGEPVGEEVRVIPGEGRTLIPGLVELHTHLSLPAWGKRHGKIWLSFGVTSVRSPAAPFARIQEERESVLSGRRAGPRIFSTGFTMDGDRVYYGGALSIQGPEELEQHLSRAVDAGYDLVKTYVRLDDAKQKAVIERAHRHGMPVTSHEIFPAVANGIDGIEHITGTSRRGFSPKATDLGNSYADVVEIIGRSGVEFTPTLLIYGGFSLAIAREPDLVSDERIHRLFPPWVSAALKERKAGDVETQEALLRPVFDTIRRIDELGGTILAGTDSPIVPYGLSLLLEMEQLSDAGLGPLKTIQGATQKAARALGLEDSLGTIEEGKLADLVVLEENPSEDIRALRSTQLVVLNGRVVSMAQLLRY